MALGLPVHMKAIRDLRKTNENNERLDRRKGNSGGKSR